MTNRTEVPDAGDGWTSDQWVAAFARLKTLDWTRQGGTMPSRNYDDIARKARAKWSPQAHDIAARLGEQLDAEVRESGGWRG